MKAPVLNHINLVVRDVERSADFYCSLFGMMRQWDVGDFVFLACGSCDVALVGGAPRIHPKFHFGFRMDDRAEVDAWLARVQAHGAEVTHGPKDYGDYYTFTCRDPDGYGIEVYFEEPEGGRVGMPE